MSLGDGWSSAFWRSSLATFLVLLPWNECLLLLWTTICSSMTGADGLSLRYDGGGVGDPLFSEFVLILL